MKKLKLGWIGFIDHESTVFWDQCRSLRAIGYQGMELAEFLLDLPGGYENIKRLNEIGICALTVLPEMEQLRENGVEAFIEKAKMLGVDNIAVHSCCITDSFHGKMVSFEAFKADVALLEKCAEQAAREGLVLRYHNHFQEFATRYSGISAFDYMMRNSEHLQLKLDIGWAHYAGVNPLHILQVWPNRIHSLHLKDYRHEPLRPAFGIPMPAFCTIGNGVVNTEECLKAACELGIEWAVVEQDSLCRLDPMQSLMTSYCNIKEMGYAE